MVIKSRTLSFSDHNLVEYPTILKKFDLAELRSATRNFSRRNILAQGRFGTVYRGLLSDGSLVAIKRPKNGHLQDMEARFLTEVRNGSNMMARHPNVLRLIGFCCTKDARLLVYPPVASRSLASCLRKSPPLLDWATRKKIALGVAYGLAHLHRGLVPVHRDVRASNIWLNEELNPVLGDFGLDLAMSEEDIVGEEEHCQQKNDVLAYGNILLKLVTGERTFCVDQAAEDDVDIFLAVDSVKRALRGHVHGLSSAVDPNLQGYFDENEAQLLINLGLLCIHRNAARRPEMSEVVKMLEDETPAALLRTSLNSDENLLDYLSGNLSLPKRFTLDELRVATRKFRPSNFLGEGSFSTVHWGKLADSSLVAVKRLRSDTAEDAERQFETEVMIGSNRMAQHPNLLPLIGFCCEASESLLVYPLMINNSLEHHLRRSRDRNKFPPLAWPTRKLIALGAARGLAHLHDQFVPPIIHRDICPSNILLDMGFEAAVGDFGWARLMNEGDTVEGAIEWSFTNDFPFSPHLYRDTYVNTIVRGTNGYIASEYKNTGKCSQKSDVFAFGNLILELVTGQKAGLMKTSSGNLDLVMNRDLQGDVDKINWDLDRIVDKELSREYDRGEAERLIGIAKMCTNCNPSMRPKMREVVRAIEG
ncbi:proline-rich receptor-like protein kinase PERK15 [Punica granatum]|uniref:Uncharacterized protein n=2 Tax=Punica granatum TaxID=22663 RepID=A0A2I0HLK9_PUNGR|nr:proline-rich receptor-like protein kinase PERK15 [Punica granatum]PKI32609.1 hypothetical protein CRG98_047006 [Punica granatum]